MSFDRTSHEIEIQNIVEQKLSSDICSLKDYEKIKDTQKKALQHILEDIISDLRQAEFTEENRKKLAYAFYSLAKLHVDNKAWKQFEEVKNTFENCGTFHGAKNERAYKKIAINFALDNGRKHRKSKNYREAFAEYLNAFAALSQFIAEESFTRSYKFLKVKAQAEMIKTLGLILSENNKDPKKYALAVKCCEDAKIKGFDAVGSLDAEQMNQLRYAEAQERKAKAYDPSKVRLLPKQLTDFYAPSFVGNSIKQGAYKGVMPMIEFFIRFPNAAVATAVVFFPLTLALFGVGASTGAACGLAHGFFTAFTRKPLDIAMQQQLPGVLKNFLGFDEVTKRTVISQVVDEYQNKWEKSSANSKSSVELLNLLKLREHIISLEKKWAAIDAYMLEPYDRNDQNNKLLKNNGKKMFMTIHATINAHTDGPCVVDTGSYLL
jgi:hypothetical protein